MFKKVFLEYVFLAAGVLLYLLYYGYISVLVVCLITIFLTAICYGGIGKLVHFLRQIRLYTNTGRV